MTGDVGGSSPPSRTNGLEPAERGTGGDVPGAGGATPPRTAKLYAITRRDLSNGFRTAQVGHALMAWVVAHGEPPDNLVVLRVADEAALLYVAEQLAPHDPIVFREPDLGDAATAIAVGPGARRAVSSLPLL